MMKWAGFDWIIDIAYESGCELVASFTQAGDKWWHSVESEGANFTKLFKGAISRVFQSGHY